MKIYMVSLLHRATINNRHRCRHRQQTDAQLTGTSRSYEFRRN